MRRFALLLACAFTLTGCDDLDDKEDTDPGFLDPNLCSAGYSQASSAGFTSFQFTVGAAAQFVAFDQNAEYDGYGASACMSDDGNTAIWIVETGGEPFARITVFASSPGTKDTSDTSGATITIDILSGTESGSSVTNGEYTTSNWFVDQAGSGTIETTFNGTGLGGLLVANFAAEMTQ